MNSSPPFKTADLYDAYENRADEVGLRVFLPVFRNYGGKGSFSGQVATVKVFEDNVLVRELLSTPGRDRVLVVDGGGSLRYALVGDVLAQLAIDNGWNGVVVSGCIRDTVDIGTMPIGVKALASNPRRCVKRGHGVLDIPVEVAGVTVVPGDWLYADGDGVIIASREL